MYNINLEYPLQGLDNESIGNLTLGKILANRLIAVTTGNPLKFYNWATGFHHGKIVSMDKSDLTTLKEFIENQDLFTNLFKAQCLLILDEVKDEK